MNLEINQIASTAINKNNNNDVSEKNANKEEKPQLKEHCSSKAAKALRGMALGLALAASVTTVTTGTISTTAQASENQPANNTTSVSEEQEANVQKTDVEMAVENLLEESEVQTSTLHVGDKNTCYGKMTMSPFLGGRDYDMAKISDAGNLDFYKSVQYRDSDDDVHTYYVKVNSFDLGTETNGSSIELQVGSRFDQSDKENGDYVELAEDGRTFIVYNGKGEEIGHVRADTPDSYNAKVTALVATGAVLGAGYMVTEALKNKKS